MARPRKYPEGSTSTERTAARRRALTFAGGKTVTVDLSAEAVAALQAVRAKIRAPSDAAAVEHAIRETAGRT